MPDANKSKSGAALLSLAGMMDAKQVSENVLKVGGPKDISTFYGFYVLQALAKSGDTDTALDFIRTYSGAMLDLGATTFWEDFNLEWTKNAARIDELVPPGRRMCTATTARIATWVSGTVSATAGRAGRRPG